jgi:chemotaxis protein methyltransferase CheR
MKPEDFLFYKKFLHHQSGLSITEEKTYLLESRLMPVARNNGFSDLESMTKALRTQTDSKLGKQVVDSMTTNETLFFRDDRPFKQFREVVLPNILKARENSKTIRIWSAASSTGQEPYSLAMTISESFPQYQDWKIEILGTDLSDAALARAKKGEFSQFEIQRGLPIQMVMKYFKQEGTVWKIQDKIRNMVKFENFNLLNKMDHFPVFDIIFCRNVLIYFDEPTKKKIIQNMMKKLSPDGFLFLGASETILGLCSEFKIHHSYPGLYTLKDLPPPVAATPATRTPIPAAAKAPAPAPAATPAQDLKPAPKTLQPEKGKAEKTPKRVLIIAESDSCGAAGVQGDVKTVLALGGYAMTAITALTAHGAGDILSINNITPSFVGDQIQAAIKDVGADSIKVGFLQNEAIINVVADVLQGIKKSVPIVVDPSIVSRSGKTLMDNNAISALKRKLYIQTTILTPNLKEVEILGAMNIADIDDMRRAAEMMRTLGVKNIVLKGGQVESSKELYFVATPAGERIYQRPTVKTPHTLGAGGAFSSALALNMARNMNIFDATEHALDFMHQAIIHSTGFGHAGGPVNHAFHIQQRSQVFHPEEIKIYKI